MPAWIEMLIARSTCYCRLKSVGSPPNNHHRVKGSVLQTRAKEDRDRSSDDAHTVCPISPSTWGSSHEAQEHAHITVALAAWAQDRAGSQSGKYWGQADCRCRRKMGPRDADSRRY